MRPTAKRAWLAVALGALVLIAGMLVKRTEFPGRAFDAPAWQADAETGSGVRQEMADRLIARGNLKGMSRKEVVDLLGEPPPTPYFAEWDLVYWLGPERGFMSIDSEWLVLRLGADGRVEDNRLVRD